MLLAKSCRGIAVDEYKIYKVSAIMFSRWNCHQSYKEDNPVNPVGMKAD